MLLLNQNCDAFFYMGTNASAASKPIEFGTFKKKHLFFPVYGYRQLGIYTIEREGNFLTVLGYIQQIAQRDELYCMVIPDAISNVGMRYLDNIQLKMWERGINLVYLYGSYGADPRETRVKALADILFPYGAIEYFDKLYVSPQQSLLDFMDIMGSVYSYKLVYLGYAIAGLECTIESYRKMMELDAHFYANMPMLIGTLDQLKLYPEATRITKGYASGDILVRGLDDMSSSPHRNCKPPFILMPWKPSHEPYKVPIINDVLFELMQQGYDVYSPYQLRRSDGTELYNYRYDHRDDFLQALRFGPRCVVPLLEPLHHCLHYTVYELLAYGNRMITVANEELPEWPDIVGNELDLEHSLRNALIDGYQH